MVAAKEEHNAIPTNTGGSMIQQLSETSYLPVSSIVALSRE
jgi:hypothetical protein